MTRPSAEGTLGEEGERSRDALLRRRELLLAGALLAASGLLPADPAAAEPVPGRGLPFDDGTYFDDGTGWVE